MKLITAYILGFVYCCAQAQDKSPALINVIPPSPNAAAFAKFGNTPVSYFTGLPNISIPLFNISSGKLNLPININYHASGIKVEEIASTVGLGWALSAGGMITRSLRGIGDDEYNGYFNQNLNMHTYDLVTHPTSANAIESLREAAKQTNDVEADLFYFNMGGISGKFVYNQEEHKFYSIPRQDIKIEYNGTVSSPGTFKITLASGDIYFFNDIEKTKSQAICIPATANGVPHATSWCLSKILSFDKKDSISFAYEPYNYQYDALGTETRYVLKNSFSVIPNNIPEGLKASKCSEAISVDGQRLTKIIFNNGTLNFHSNTGRCDLIGDKRLDDIELDNSNGQMIKKLNFDYSYFGSNQTLTNCTDYGQAENIRLKLNAVRETSVNNDVTDSLPPYQFEYNESLTLPGRNSYAQDYWGYYNGKIQNNTLIPNYTIFTDAGPQQYSGSDRSTDPSFSSIGTLTRVTYPTGGSTDYLFENNEVSDVQAQIQAQNNSVLLAGDGQGVQTNYEQTFTINYGPNDYNGHNINGGAFVNFDFGEIGCDISQGASTCAILALQGLTPGTTGGTFSHAVNNSYLPNGTYKLTASFQQNPANFADFYFRARWQSPDTTLNAELHRYTGGLRIAKITDHDGIDPSHDIVKIYKYNLLSDPGKSSGKLNGYPNANYFVQDPFTFHYFQYVTNGDASGVNDIVMEFAKISSYSNKPMLQTQGSYTSYSNVTEIYGLNSENGKTVYKYSNDPDDIGIIMPYTATSNEYRRGLLLEKTDYAVAQANYVPVKKIINKYAYKRLPAITSSTSLKTFFDVTGGGDQDVDVSALIYTGQYDVPKYEEYADTCSWVGLVKSEERSYDTTDTTKFTSLNKEFGYSDYHYLLASEKLINSKGDTITTLTTYPPDYNFDSASTSGNALAIRNFLNKNIVDMPIETMGLHSSGSSLKSTFGKINIYKPDDAVIDSVLFAKIEPNSNFVINPSTIVNGGMIISSAYEPRTKAWYNNHNKLQEQKLIGGSSTVYLWGYKNEYPIVLIQNATYSSVFSALHNANIDPESLSNQGSIDLTTLSTIRRTIASGCPNSLITTYSYTPLVGITTVTDPKGMSTYYEYDDFQRLKNIKDNHGNIVKHFEYHYKGQ